MLGGLIHDIGKVEIPDHILQKPGSLTPDEFFMMKQHVSYTEEVIQEMAGLPQLAIQVALEHHERIDGSGYPKGKKGDEISQFGKMAAIVDVYDAITSTRCYREGSPPSLVLKQMMGWGGKQLDRELLNSFIRCIGIFPVGSAVELTGGQWAIILEKGKNPLHPIVKIFGHRRSGQKVEKQEIDLEASRLRIVDFVDMKKKQINLKSILGMLTPRD